MNLKKIAIIILCFNVSSSEHAKNNGQKNQLRNMTKKKIAPKATESSKQSVPVSQRMIGGEPTHDDEYHFMVAISDTSDRGFVYGSGVIIAPQWILTAWHLVEYAVRKRRANIIVTPKYDNSISTSKKGKKYQAAEYFCPNYGGFFGGDIALIKLREPLPLGREPYNIEKIEMIRGGSYLEVGRSLWMAGWGAYKMINVFWQIGIPVPSEYLMKAEIQVKPDKECLKNFIIMYDYPRKFCAGFASWKKDRPCKGDSGSPVVLFEGQSTRPILVGIASTFSPLCE